MCHSVTATATELLVLATDVVVPAVDAVVPSVADVVVPAVDAVVLAGAAVVVVPAELLPPQPEITSARTSTTISNGHTSFILDLIMLPRRVPYLMAEKDLNATSRLWLSLRRISPSPRNLRLPHAYLLMVALTTQPPCSSV